jgi:lipoyl(octanoyl) transferase
MASDSGLMGSDAVARARGAADQPRIARPPALVTRHLGLVAYDRAYSDMRRFTASRTIATPDEVWLLEHPAVYTLGQAGKPEHLLRATPIPVQRVDRGGQITYHGPGQVVAYTLLDLRRRGLAVRRLVGLLEQAVIDLLAAHGIAGERRPGAPGVYVAPSGCECGRAAATTAWRSTSRWTSCRLATSIPAGTRASPSPSLPT